MDIGVNGTVIYHAPQHVALEYKDDFVNVTTLLLLKVDDPVLVQVNKLHPAMLDNVQEHGVSGVVMVHVQRPAVMAYK